MDIYWKLKYRNHSCKFSVLSVIVILYFCKQSCTNFATAIGISTKITAGLILIPFVCLVIYFSLVRIQDIKWDGILLYILCAVFFAVTIEIHPEYMNRFRDIYNDGRFSAYSVFALGAGIYTYYIIRLYNGNADNVYNTFRMIPYVIFFLNLGTLINRSAEYAMDFGYQMEMAAILFLAQYLDEKQKPHKLIFSFVAIFLGVIYGARATILGYVIFIALYMIWKNQMTLKKGFLICVGIIGVILYNSRTFMIFLYNYISSMGLHSRTLYLIASGDVLAADTARQERIWPVLNEVLKNSSIFKMYGAYGDRYFLNAHYPYAHSIIYEMLITFGKLLGGIILICIFINFFTIILKDKTKGGLMTLIFGSFSICRLMISSSFWIEPYFWAFIAIMVNCKLNNQATVKKKRRRKN